MKSGFRLFKVMLIILMLIGSALIFFGIKRNLDINTKTENYELTEGYFIDTELYSEADRIGKRRKSATYSLIYIYQVNGIDYTVKTDYGTGIIPQYGTAKEILYNPLNPAEAVISGTNGSTVLVLVGAFFLLIPSVFLVVILTGEGVFDGWKFNIMDFVAGMVFLILGIGIIYFIAEGFSIKRLFMGLGPFALIPIMFLFVGTLMVVRAFKGTKEA